MAVKRELALFVAKYLTLFFLWRELLFAPGFDIFPIVLVGLMELFPERVRLRVESSEIRELTAPCRTEIVFRTRECFARRFVKTDCSDFRVYSRCDFSNNFALEINSIRVPVFGGVRSANTAFNFSLVIRLANFRIN